MKSRKCLYRSPKSLKTSHMMLDCHECHTKASSSLNAAGCTCFVSSPRQPSPPTYYAPCSSLRTSLHPMQAWASCQALRRRASKPDSSEITVQSSIEYAHLFCPSPKPCTIHTVQSLSSVICCTQCLLQHSSTNHTACNPKFHSPDDELDVLPTQSLPRCMLPHTAYHNKQWGIEVALVAARAMPELWMCSDLNLVKLRDPTTCSWWLISCQSPCMIPTNLPPI